MLIFALLANVSVAQPPAPATDIAVVVNPANPIGGMTMGELRKTFAGEKHQWPSGIPIKLIVRNAGSRERTVLLHMLRMSESDYNQYWTGQVLRGEATVEPANVPSIGMQKEAIHAFPGAITLLVASDVKPGMKVLKIDRLLPGESGYPLH